MNKIFQYEGKLLQTLQTIADLMIVNILILVCCLPLVTTGASFSAGHYTIAKIRRNEGDVIKNFFHSFKENQKQGLCLTLVSCGGMLFLVMDIYLCSALTGVFQQIVAIILGIIALFFGGYVTWLFPLQATISNRIRETLYNAFILTLLYLPKSIIMLVLYLCPIILFMLSPWFFLFLVMFGFSIPIFGANRIYTKIFKAQGVYARSTANNQ